MLDDMPPRYDPRWTEVDSQLPPKGVLAAGLLDLLATLPGYVYRRHASLLLQFPSPVSTRPPVRHLVKMIGLRRAISVSSR